MDDPKLELQAVSALVDLSTYDLPEARRAVERWGVSETDFEEPINWQVYAAAVDTIRSGVPCSPDNLVRHLRPRVGDKSVAVLAWLDDSMGAHLDGYFKALIEAGDRRVARRQLQDALASLQRPGSDVGAIKFRLGSAMAVTRGSLKTTGMDEHVDAVEAHLRSVSEGKTRPVTPWYIAALDGAVGGLQPTLILVGAEPGVGKSALFASAISLQAKHGHKPFVASLEDSPDWLAFRLVANDSNRDQSALRFQRLNSHDLNDIHHRNETWREIRSKIRVIDGSETGIRIEDLISSINDSIVNEGCDSVWIDHLGEIPLGNHERPDLEISRHLSLLRGVANRHGVPVVVAAHFKRPFEGGSGASSPPTFRDFANSAGAERKARVALGLRREPGSDVLKVYVLKQTNGPAGQVVELRFGGTAAMVIDCEGSR